MRFHALTTAPRDGEYRNVIAHAWYYPRKITNDNYDACVFIIAKKAVKNRISLVKLCLSNVCVS